MLRYVDAVRRSPTWTMKSLHTSLKIAHTGSKSSTSLSSSTDSLLKLCQAVFSKIYLSLKAFSNQVHVCYCHLLLNKPSLDPKSINTFLSQLYPHVTSSPNFNHLQSAYRIHNSTEIAVLSFKLIAVKELVSLDLNTAFDTINHSTILSPLSSTSFGVNNTPPAGRYLISQTTHKLSTLALFHLNNPLVSLVYSKASCP